MSSGKAKEYIRVFDTAVALGVEPEKARQIALSTHSKPKKKHVQWNRMGILCDAPNCQEPFKFQCGRNRLGKTGSWCSDAHFNRFAQ